MHYQHAMADIESLSLNKGRALILSFGVVLFNIQDNDTFEDLVAPGRCFYTALEIEQQIASGRKIDGGTILWWLEQNKAAQMSLVNSPRYDVGQAMDDFIDWIKERGPGQIWGNGNEFDISNLESLCDDYGRNWPFGFRNNHSLRTLRLLAGSPAYPANPKGFIAHDALDDAKKQVLDAQRYWRIINGK